MTAIVALYMAVAGLLAELAELEWMVQLVQALVLVLLWMAQPWED